MCALPPAILGSPDRFRHASVLHPFLHDDTLCCAALPHTQGFMWLFGLVAIAFAVYGLATVDKNVTDGAFNVLTSITTFANGAFDTLDHLLLTISGTTDM